MNFWQFPETLHHNTAVIYPTGSLSYLQLELLVVEFMALLPESRSLVALQCNNDLDTLVAYLACLKKRVAMLLMDGQKNIEESASLLATFRVSAVIQRGHITRSQKQTTVIDPRLAIMISTSGSTGSAKQVALSYENLAANSQSICDFLPIISSDTAITTLPFQYSYGLSIINTHLQKGACILLSDNPVTSREFWSLLDKFNVSSFAGVPYTYEMLKRLGFLRKKYSSIRYLSQAGGRLSDDLTEALSVHLRSQGKQFYVMYGQTEATARMSWLAPEKLPDKVGAIGNPIPGGKFTLLNEDRVVDEPDQIGELIYQGPNIMLGYAVNAADLATFNPPGCLHTGDLAKRDEDGDYYIVGRLKRIVKIFGSRINLDEIEKLLEIQGYYAKVVGSDLRLYIALNDENRGEVDDFSSSDRGTEVIQYLAKTLRLHPSVISLSLMDAFPLKINQKIDYTRLLQFFEEQHAH